MTIEQLLSYPWHIMLPEFIVLGVATVLSLLDLFMNERRSRRFFGWIGLGGILVALGFVCMNTGAEVQHILYDTFRLDGVANLFKLLLLAGTAIVFILSMDDLRSERSPYEGEFYYLLLAGLLGAMVVASSADMITLFVGIELLSIAAYILVGIRKKRLKSNESAMKYIITGSIATAVMLYGMSFIYGVTGTTNLFEVAERLQLAFENGYDLMIYTGFILTFVGMSFKISVMPFHMWTPDVYQGASTPITAFLSVVSKAAGFALIIRFFVVAFFGVGMWQEPIVETELVMVEMSLIIGIAAAAAMIVGNVLALRQTNVKRLLAYSSIAQAGYILVPFAVAGHLLLYDANAFYSMIAYYLAAYLLMNFGAFTVVQFVTRQQGSEDIRSFAGLYHHTRWSALAMTFFLISLAGLPLTAGFIGKLYIFIAAFQAGSAWLAIIMVLTTILSYYYYFRIIRQMYMRPAEAERTVQPARSMTSIVGICVVGSILLVILPNVFMDVIVEYFHFGEIFQQN